MQGKKMIVLAMAAICALQAPETAQAQLDGHHVELTLQGGANQPLDEAGTATSYSLGAGLAIRAGSHLRIGAEFVFDQMGLNQGTRDALAALGIDASLRMYEYGGFARYHFLPGLAGPYVKGSLGARRMEASLSGFGGSLSGDETVMGFGLGAGWMFKGRSDVATFFEIEYGYAFAPGDDDTASVEESKGFDLLKMSIGVAFGM